MQVGSEGKLIVARRDPYDSFLILIFFFFKPMGSLSRMVKIPIENLQFSCFEEPDDRV